MNSSENINKNEMNKKSSTMRLIAYMKPYAHWVIFALLLVLGLTAFDLYRPMLVGDAIDTFGANGDYDVISHSYQICGCTCLKLCIQHRSDLDTAENRPEYHSSDEKRPLQTYPVSWQQVF